jgi:hypothetical protein
MNPLSEERSRFAVYDEPPAHNEIPLSVQPRLESWDATGSPSQLALAGYLDHLEAVLKQPASLLDKDPLVLKLSVGLPTTTDLTGGGRDLDNYVFPVIRRLGAARFVSVWANKSHGASSVAIDGAVQRETVLPDWQFGCAVTRSSSQTSAWKHEVAAQMGLHAIPVTGDGPVELQLSFRLHPRRNWSMVWKPAIDALGCVLGDDPGAGRSILETTVSSGSGYIVLTISD